MTKSYQTEVVDRKLLKKIDQGAMRASMIVILGYIVVGSWILTVGGFYKESFMVSVVLGAFIVLTSLVRIIMNLMFDSLYGKGPLRWRRLFYFMNNFQAAGWSLFMVIVLLHEGLTANTFSTWMLTGGIGGAAIINSPVHLRTNKLLVSIYWLPTLAALLISFDPVYVFIGLGVFVYYAFLLRQAAYLFTAFWEKEEMQRSLNKKIADLERVKNEEDKTLSAQQQFIQTITHEIRTPMNNILGMLSLLEDSYLNKTQHEYQVVAARSAETLLELIEDALDFSKISSGEIHLENHFFNIHMILNDCVEMLGPVAHEKKLELSYVCDPHIPFRVKGDSKRIKQVLVNLVTNAIKYSDAGEIVIEVQMSYSSANQGLLRIEVSDQGPGISLINQADIFEAFNRLEQGAYSSGAGLGLTICRGLVNCMQGEMGVFSKEGQGSTFWFTVPVKISTQQTEALKVHPAMAGKKVLVVGASQGINRFLQAEMSQWGINTRLATGEDEAQQELSDSVKSQTPYDLIIINMPIDRAVHLGLSSTLFNDPQWLAIPQIILSSLAQRGTATTLNHSKTYEKVLFLTKPLVKKSLYLALVHVWHLGSEKLADVTVLQGAMSSSDEAMNTVLLVEDNNVNQMVTKGMLKKLGCQVLVVSNGVEALGSLEDKSFDLILMDCVMPVMDGYAATQEIRLRESVSGQHVPVIAMTANISEGDEQRCLAAGMDDYLAKPVTAAALETKLRRWLGAKQAFDTDIKSETFRKEG